MARQMKNSGIEWIGKIPEEWEISRGKYVLEYLQKPVYETDDVVTCFRDGEVTLRTNRREDGFTMADKEIGYQGVDVGDLVVHGMDGFAGAIGISDSRGKASPVVNVLSSYENKRYLMYYLRVMAQGDVFLALATGIRVRSVELRWNKLAELPYPVPPRRIQDVIVSFLDEKTNEINDILSDIQTEIETLESYKKSIIIEAVTKGLDQDVEMKDSGIEWIGDIPKGWQVSKVKYNLIREENRNPGNQEILSVYREYGVIPKDSRDDNHNVTSLDTSNYKHVKPNFLVINKMKAWQGSMGISEYEGVVSPAYFVYKISNQDLIPIYLHYLFRNCYVDEFRRISSGIREGQWDLPATGFENLPLIIPSKREQNDIVELLSVKCRQIDQIISDKQEQLNVLEQYKQSLIYEYVTGKKEVKTDEPI